MQPSHLKKLFWYALLAVALKLLLVRYVVFGTWGLVPFLTAELAFAVLIAALPGAEEPKSNVSGFLVADAIVSALMLVVLLFFAYFGRVPSVQALTWASRLGGVTGSVLALLRPWHAALFADLPLFWAAGRFVPGFGEAAFPVRARRAVLGVAAAAVAANVAVGVFAPAADVTGSAYRYGVVAAQAIDAIGARLRPSGVEIDVTDPGAVRARVGELSGRPSAPRREVPPGEAEGRHVFVVLMESLQGFAVGAAVDGQPVTPNIDALAADGLLMRNGYAQVSAGNTSDAEFMLNTSLYPLGDKPVSENLGAKTFPSLPRVLDGAGYTTMTFHANDLEFWNRDQLYPALGFEKVYARDFFGETDILGIGPSDEVLYAKALPEIEAAAGRGETVYASLVSLTSHHPFKLPPDKRGLELGSELEGTLVGDYLVSQNYSDRALGEFIGGLKAAGLYEKSVIVVVGDHFGLQQAQMTSADTGAAARLLGRPYNDADRMCVPIVIAAPGAVPPRAIERPAGQVDVMPTLLAMLGIPDEGVRFGRDILSEGPVMLGERYYLPVGSHITDSDLVIVRLDGAMEAYDARTRSPKEKLPAGAEAGGKRAEELQRLSDAYLMSLPER